MGTPEPMNTPSALGAALVILAALGVILWGFGLDRFLWIAAGTGLAGVVLVAIGAVTSRGTS